LRVEKRPAARKRNRTTPGRPKAGWCTIHQFGGVNFAIITGASMSRNGQYYVAIVGGAVSGSVAAEIMADHGMLSYYYSQAA
jgi:hypothetical protein